jgi:hypothetical protein
MPHTVQATTLSDNVIADRIENVYKDSVINLGTEGTQQTRYNVGLRATHVAPYGDQHP